MGKYLKKFSTHTEYQTYITSEGFVMPNVSLCVNENDVHFNPNNYILYEASAKLPETTSQKNAGLHTNAFNTTIASHTFEDGEGRIVFNDDVTRIGNYAFYYSTGLTSITLPESIEYINIYAFQGCSGLQRVSLSYSVLCESTAFSGCSGITDVFFSKKTRYISGNTFTSSPNIQNITVDDKNPFYDSRGNCNAIIETSTNKMVFGGCDTVIPNSVTSIGQYAFQNRTGLTSITIPNSVTSIGQSAFYYCSGLTSITIPNSVTSIGQYAFQNCTGLTSITIPDSVTSIGYGAFNSCSGLTSVTIGSGVTSIGENAFRDCTGLTSIIIPDSVTSIWQGAFYGCSGLTSATIGNSVTSIGYQAFYNCTGLTSVTIGNGVTSIGQQSFRNCSGLTSITCSAMSAPTISNDTFQSVKTGGTLYVPTGSTGYDVWMGNSNYYLGKYNWTKVEQ